MNTIDVINLPDHVLEDIFARLSIKCLKKLQCVCKVWCDLIRSQHFIYIHLDHPSREKNSGADYLILAQKEHEKRASWDPYSLLSFYSLSEDRRLVRTVAPRNFPPSFPASYENLSVEHVFGPCNGIVGLVVRYGEYGNRKEAIYLCNPATGESRRLPDCTLNLGAGADCFGTNACGLGFDPHTKEYKVVSILFYSFRDSKFYPNHGFYRMGIYYLSSNTWKEVELHLPDNMRAPKGCSNKYARSWDGSGVHMKGRLHWLLDKDTIVYFDISSEIMGHIPCPGEIKNGSRHIALLEDSLALVEVSESGLEELDSDSSSVCVWTMVDYGASESWMNRLSFSYSFRDCGSRRIVCWNNELLFFGPRFLFSVNLVENESQMKTYKLGDCKPVNELVEGDLVDKFEYHRRVVGAVIFCGESLVPLR